MTNPTTSLLIVGAGPAGLTAAIYGARAMLRPLVLEGPQPGGQLTITTDVENWPGDASVMGPDLMARMSEHARGAGARFQTATVEAIDHLEDGSFRARLDDGSSIDASTVLVASGAVARWLGIPGEDTFRGYGVSACATCDGFFFKGRTVVVVGGGNTALEEALFLTRFARKVLLVHRRDRLRGERVLQERVRAHPGIEIVWNAQPIAVVGQEGPVPEVDGLVVRQDGVERTIACGGVFVAIGHVPASGMVAHLLDLNPDGTIPVVPGTSRTAIPGLFAAGDVADSHYRQAVTSAGMGCMAALDAERWLAERG